MPRARSHLLSAGPRATLARQTSAAARAIGMLTSRAKVACCCLLMANGLTAAELLCADSRTQAAESLQLCSSRILEWMERFQGATRHVSPAARACQGKRVCIMYRRACGPLLSCLAVLVLYGNPCDFKNDPVTSGQRYYKPFNSHVYKSSHARGSIINIPLRATGSP